MHAYVYEYKHQLNEKRTLTEQRLLSNMTALSSRIKNVQTSGRYIHVYIPVRIRYQAL